MCLAVKNNEPLWADTERGSAPVAARRLAEEIPDLGFAHFKPRRRVNPQVGGTGQPGLSIYPVLRLDFVQKLAKL